MIYDVIIIGGGPAGYSAALYCGRAQLNTLLIEKLMPGGQMGTTEQIDNYPGFNEGIGGVELAMNMQAGAERFGAKTEYAEVKGVELSGDIKKVKTDSDVFECRAVILATGAYPRKLGLDNEDSLRGRGVSYCATCDAMFFKDKTVAVVGGGDTAAADALVLSKVCKKVYLIHRRDTLRANKSYSAPLEKCGNVEFVWNSNVTALTGKTKLEAIEVTDNNGKTTTLDCDGIFVAIGYLPDTKLVYGHVKLDAQGYVDAGEDTKTSEAGVFAAGDLRAKPLRQVVTAACDGAVAATMALDYLMTKEN